MVGLNLELFFFQIKLRDLCTCACVKSVKVDCSKSTFEMFRSDSDDLFGLVEEKNLKSKISIFNLADVLPMVNCYTTLSSDIIETGPTNCAGP